MALHTRSTRIRFATMVALAGVLALDASAQEPTPDQRDAFMRPAPIPFPRENPYTAEKASLGKMLFFESRLSRDKNLSCASCHNPSFGWEVPFAQAIGAGGKPLGRHSPTVLNRAWGKAFFWDGRASTLEVQARGPIEAGVEMDLPLPTAVERLKEVEGYQHAFAKAFPKEGLTEATVLQAIATFERTIVTGTTPFDRWMAGDAKAISAEAKRGFAVFTGKAKCASCHNGWNFTDDKFHDIGLPTEDKGRSGVSGSAEDDYAFKTPGLREIAARAPYMHRGQLVSLESVIAHYVTGGVDRPSRSVLMTPTALSPLERQELVAFMKSLSSPQATLVMPNLPAR